MKPIKKPQKKIRKYWYVGFIMGKTGKKVLEKMNLYFPEIKCWFPQMETAKVVNGNFERVNEALFENYIFVKLPENSYNLQKTILEKVPIAYFLKDDDTGLLVPLNNDDVVHMQAIETLCYTPIKEEYVGKEVKIVKGAFKNFTGKCLKKVLGGCRYEVEVCLFEIRKKKLIFNADEIKLIHEEEEIKIYPEMGNML